MEYKFLNVICKNVPVSSTNKIDCHDDDISGNGGIVETHLRPTSFFNKEEKDNFTVLANGRLY